MADRPRWLVVVAGTGTDVGKTWVAARLAEHGRAAGLSVAARKPAQSFDPDSPRRDADVLAAATGEPVDVVCRPDRSYERAMAPFMAAAVLGRPPIAFDDLVAELVWPPGVALGLVESVGGVRSPMTDDGGDTVRLVEALSPDAVLLVADAGLGTINAVRLAVEALAGQPTTVLLNRFDPHDQLHAANHAWLVAHLPHPVVVDTQALPLAGRRQGPG